ncbi:MAG: sirohydrochlorin cobaltochelatase [Treponema sp.]|jgi:sirohydrochlorin cobaltochelatase|nr:sirohydrochlorin cobaltochelatase [Treponema sp.]
MKKSLQSPGACRRWGGFATSLLLPVCLLAILGCSRTGEAEGGVQPVLLVVSFGTSFNDSREKTIGAVERAITAAFPDYEIRRAFTSQIIIDKLKERDGLEIDNVREAMERLVRDGVKEVAVQPTQVMNGFEYDDTIAEIKSYESRFSSIKYGRPLLSSDADYQEVINALTEGTKQYNDGSTAVIFMGHGTGHAANAAYGRLNDALKAAGHDHYIIGTVEAEPSIEDVAAAAKGLGVKRAVLSPLMIVAGDHATNDMAGDEDDSWKSILEADGFEVAINLRGLGEYPGIQTLFVNHAKDAIGR